ncbi:MAG: hypothetical protein ACUVUG_06065 [Candidatus Aminicenantia bacterium]
MKTCAREFDRLKGVEKEFIKFSLSDKEAEIVEKVGTSIPLPEEEREKILKTLE